jgi:hypothetical protein
MAQTLKIAYSERSSNRSKTQATVPRISIKSIISYQVNNLSTHMLSLPLEAQVNMEKNQIK